MIDPPLWTLSTGGRRNQRPGDASGHLDGRMQVLLGLTTLVSVCSTYALPPSIGLLRQRRPSHVSARGR
jgi:hypothetical protein